MAVPLWGDPADWTNPAPLRGDVRADVCVVGLGGSGLAAVGALLDAGATVAAIDAGPVAGGAAGRNGGFLLAGTARFHHDAVASWGRERAAELYRETLAEIDRLAAELGPAIVRLTGSLRLPSGEVEAEDCAHQLEALRADGFEAAASDGGVVVAGDGAVDPLARCRSLARQALRRGARLFAGTAAVAIRGDRVRTPEGAVDCGAVVVAVDGGLERVLEELGGRVRSTRLQMLGTAPVAPRFPRPVYYRWGFDYWQQLPDGRVVLGGGRDRHAGTEWGAGPEPSDVVQEGLDALLRRKLGVEAPVTHRWAGVVGYTEDALPILEVVRPGVLAVGGQNGHGNVIGSAAGRAAAAIALGEPAPALARLLRPETWDDGSPSSRS
ncbi:MAG: gamma-glutamylputrescine oxidase [Solirubrobacteraceae bacterium]|jgi:gamma-glutamylputrescine oxidase|nr:gamma-glutamylputrescine oxidase [Solirubrobacteraceae bacterium]